MAKIVKITRKLAPDAKDGSCLAEDPHVVAAREQLTVHLPDEDELFLDIDDDEGMRRFETFSKVLDDNDFEVIDAVKSVSRNGRWHVRVQLAEPVTDLERILLQACLGSDPKRELLSFLRIRFNLNRPPTVFFEKE